MTTAVHRWIPNPKTGGSVTATLMNLRAVIRGEAVYRAG
jgi:hypothetical protein